MYFTPIFSHSSIKYFVWCAFLFSVLRTQAQNSIIAEIDSLLDKAWEHHVSAQLLPSLEEATKALELANTHRYDKGKGEAHFMIGHALLHIGVLKEGLKHMDEIKKTDYYKKRAIIQSEIYRLSGQFYTKLELHQLALREYRAQQKLLGSLEGEKKTMSLLYLYSNLTYTFKQMAEMDSVEKYSFLQLDLLRTLEKKDKKVYLEYVNTYSDLGWIFISKKNYEKAQAYLDKALITAEKHQVSVFFNTLIFLGELEKEQGNYQKAATYYKKALANAIHVGNRNAARNQYRKLSDFYREYDLGQDEANQYLLAYSRLNDSLERENKRVIDQALRQVLNAKDRETNMKSGKYRATVISIVAFAILLSIFFIWRARNSHNVLKKKEVILQEKETANEALNKTIQENKFNDLLVLARSNSPEFLIVFTELYPAFIQALKTIDPTIRNTELAFCAMAFLNFSTKNIAEYTFVTPRAVQIRKNRFRKKFGIPSEVDFNIWMRERV